MKADDYAIDDAEASRYRTEALHERFKELERAQNAGHIKGIDVLEPALNLLADALRDSGEKLRVIQAHQSRMDGMTSLVEQQQERIDQLEARIAELGQRDADYG